MDDLVALVPPCCSYTIAGSTRNLTAALLCRKVTLLSRKKYSRKPSSFDVLTPVFVNIRWRRHYNAGMYHANLTSAGAYGAGGYAASNYGESLLVKGQDLEEQVSYTKIVMSWIFYH